MRTPSDIVKELAIRVAQLESQAQDINATVRFDVSGEHSGSWLFQLNDKRSVAPVSASDTRVIADCTFRLTSPDFVNLFDGKITGQQLFFDGRLEVDGDLTLTLKLPAIARLMRPAGV